MDTCKTISNWRMSLINLGSVLCAFSLSFWCLRLDAFYSLSPSLSCQERKLFNKNLNVMCTCFCLHVNVYAVRRFIDTVYIFNDPVIKPNMQWHATTTVRCICGNRLHKGTIYLSFCQPFVRSFVRSFVCSLYAYLKLYSEALQAH